MKNNHWCKSLWKFLKVVYLHHFMILSVAAEAEALAHKRVEMTSSKCFCVEFDLFLLDLKNTCW